MPKGPHSASRIRLGSGGQVPVPGLLLLLCLTGATAEAQSARTTHADAAATIGWLGVDTGHVRYGDREWDGTLVGGLSAGWYWTDHVKTEVEFSAAADVEGFASITTRTEEVIQSRFRRSTIQRNGISVAQQYQFGRNAWFHPHVAAGVSVAFDRRLDHYEPTFRFDPVARTNHLVEPARTEGPIRTSTVRPFLEWGFKGYVTPRTFVRSDIRIGGTRGQGIDELTARIGMGIDF